MKRHKDLSKVLVYGRMECIYFADKYNILYGLSIKFYLYVFGCEALYLKDIFIYWVIIYIHTVQQVYVYSLRTVFAELQCLLLPLKIFKNMQLIIDT